MVSSGLKFLFGTVLLSMAPLWANAQVDFCVPGATWLYVLEGNHVNNTIQSKVEYAGDTLFDGNITAKTLRNETRWQSFSGGPVFLSVLHQYIRQQGDSVLYLREGDWEFAFDLGVSQNDMRITHIGGGPVCEPMDTMLIGNVLWSEHFGLNLKTMHYSLLMAAEASIEGVLDGTPEGHYLERIGHVIDHPVIKQVECYEGGGAFHFMQKNLVCYTDDELLSQSQGQGCEFTLFPVGMDEVLSPEQSLRYAEGILMLDDGPGGLLVVHDLSGRKIHQCRIGAGQVSADLRSLDFGVIVVSYRCADGISLRKRFLHRW